ncbi:MAG: hypothetical protein ACT4NY_09125 [Pseudonocardiales bacterium]
MTETNTCAPEPPGRSGDDQDRLVDQLNLVVHKALCENAVTWKLGAVVGLSDAVLVATQAVIDAGWRPPELQSGSTSSGAARLQVLWLGERPVLVRDKTDPEILDHLDTKQLRKEFDVAGVLVFEREVEVL